MRKHLFIFILTIFSVIILKSQSCLPEGIVLNNQTDIDNFQSNYPNCTNIDGFVYIYDIHNTINNLNGLNSIETIGGYLKINNVDIFDFSGLDNLQTIGGDLTISNQDMITNFAGINSLTSIGGNLRISGNYSLTTCSGLENLTSIGGNLNIEYNSSLITLAGLHNLDPLSILDLSIINNYQLNTCDISSICNYLSNPNGVIEINENASGCHTLLEVADSCGVNLACLPYGNYYFLSQEDVDDFVTDYPNCSELQGNVYIYGESIVNLAGLSSITSISGNLELSKDTSQTTSLTSLYGLNNLSSIGGSLQIYNQPGLTDLSGLESLNYINDGLILGFNPNLVNLSGLENLNSVGWLEIFVNYSLANLSGIEGVTSVNGELIIFTNPELISIEGISNIDAASIQGVHLRYNSILSECNVQSICEYLISPDPSTFFWYNAQGCNSANEIMDSCGVVGCMDNGVTFTTQEEIHDFQANYPNCNLIGGDVTISGIDIVDLSPLSSIESIFGSLVITDNELLTELTGLSSLLSVDGDLIIGNNSMGGNALLISLSGLDQLYAINGELFIENNPVLNDITSIENINPSSITGLHINNNSSLSLCANECICEYIVNSGSIVNINNNSSGCNDESEVSSACFTGIVDENPKEIFAIFPNPAINNFFVKNKYKLKIKDIIVRNNLGQILIKSSSTSEEIDISDLTGGSYIVEIRSEKTTQRHKLIVSK